MNLEFSARFETNKQIVIMFVVEESCLIKKCLLLINVSEKSRDFVPWLFMLRLESQALLFIADSVSA